MSMKVKEATAVFSTRGQLVIPQYIRKEFGIEEGTKAVIEGRDDGTIVVKPVTAAAIRKGFGIIKRKPGEKPFSEWWAEYKKEERALEDAKLERCLRPR